MPEYIEREALLKVLPPKCGKDDEYALAYNTCLNCVENLIKERPTADVAEVKHGEWINPSNNPEYVNKEFFSDCSLCGFTVSEESYFCPNCGAKMDGKAKI